MGFLALNRNKRSIALDSARGRGQGGVPADGGDVRHRGGELPAGRYGSTGAGIRGAGEDQPQAGLRQHIGVRRDRAVSQPGRVRPGGAGHERADVDYRVPGRAAGQGGCADHGHRSGQFHRRWDPGRLHPRAADGSGAAGGRVAAGSGHRVHGVGVVGILRERRDTGAAGVGPPGERAVPVACAPATATSTSARRRSRLGNSFCRAIGQEALIEDERYLEPKRPQGARGGVGRTPGGHSWRSTPRPTGWNCWKRPAWWPGPSTTWSRSTATNRCWPGT